MTKIHNQRRSNFSEISHEYMLHLCGTILLAIHDLLHIMEDILSRSKLAHLFPRTPWSHGWLNRSYYICMFSLLPIYTEAIRPFSWGKTITLDETPLLGGSWYLPVSSLFSLHDHRTL